MTYERAQEKIKDVCSIWRTCSTPCDDCYKFKRLLGMIEEQYVTFEVAKLLREKGFKEETCGTYYVGGEHDGEFEECHRNNWNEYFKTPIAAPTQQMAMRWLREVHNLSIEIQIDYRQETNYKMLWFAEILKFYSSGNIRKGNVQNKLSYESAAEAAIKYCLENLI